MILPPDALAKKLHQILLLGLNRMEIDNSIRKALEAIGIDPDLPTEEQLLTGIAIMSQWEKTGQPFLSVNDIDMMRLPDEILPYAPLHTEPFLQGTLSGKFQAVLPELLFLLRQNNFLLPLHWIPAAMEKALADDTLWPYLYPVMGRRGLWMTEQLTPWRLFVENNPILEKIPKDPKAGRQQILQALAGERGYVYPRNAEDIAAPPEEPWEENFALQVLEYIAPRTSIFTPANDEGPATLLLICAQSCPSSLFYRFSSYSWPQEGFFWIQWQPLIKKFTSIVEFRQSIHHFLLNG